MEHTRIVARASLRRAFTLAELLVVVAIIAVVAGIAFPAFGAAKGRAKDSVTISNLRQCGVALLMYADDNGGIENLPTDPSAKAIFDSAPTCDPRDYWRPSCSAPSIPPMIGSYAYARFVTPLKRERDWSLFVKQGSEATLMLSIFASTNHIVPFKQDDRTDRDWGGSPFPDRVIRFQADGSVRVTTTRLGSKPGWVDPLNWWELFWPALARR